MPLHIGSRAWLLVSGEVLFLLVLAVLFTVYSVRGTVYCSDLYCFRVIMQKRTVLGIGHLTKPQLQYENAIRGMATEGNVAELGQRLREGMERELCISSENIGEVSDAADSCQALLSGVQANIEMLQGTKPTRSQVARIQAHIMHLLNRVHDIESLVQKSEDKSRLSSLYEKVCATQLEANLLTCQEDRASDDVGTANRAAATQSGLFEGFNKLPNPFWSIIQGLGEINLNNTQNMINVLWLTVKLQNQAEVLRLPQQYIFQILFPLARGKLNRIISEAIENGDSMLSFRRQILDGCVPGRGRNELLNKYFYRVQESSEQFADYVEEIRTAMVALCVDITEEEAVSNIVEGMTPEDRSRAVFCNKPKNFRELDQLVGAMQAVKLSDEVRGRSRYNERVVRGDESSAQRGFEYNRKRALNCYRCGKQGHFARDCPMSKKGSENS